ncbi:MAG: molybdopterin cofactor-binding domain-containing protein, partial [Acetobacteraceae bacterium]
FSSRATVLAGNAAYKAALELRGNLLDAAAATLGAAADDLDFVPGAIEAANGTRLPLADLAAAATPFTRPLAATVYFPAPHMTYAHGAVVAEVDLDADLGHVIPRGVWVSYDVGTVVNPKLVEAQIEGGAAQAIGGALLEELTYESSGQLLAGSFVDYLLPTADGVPPIHHHDLGLSPSPLNPLGIKGAGEAGLVGVGAAIANAVADALGEAAAVDRLPMTPERVWRWAHREGAP